MGEAWTAAMRTIPTIPTSVCCRKEALATSAEETAVLSVVAPTGRKLALQLLGMCTEIPQGCLP